MLKKYVRCFSNFISKLLIIDTFPSDILYQAMNNMCLVAKIGCLKCEWQHHLKKYIFFLSINSICS